jgi:histidinol-phosphatase
MPDHAAPPIPAELLAVAREAAAAAATVIARHYAAGVQARAKTDGSPVTDADVEAERAIRIVIARAFPDHAVYGEELGHQEGHDATTSEFLWLVDPIDGTKSFVRRYPLYSTQICVWHRGVAQAAVSSAPWFGEVAWASRGGGAFLQRTAPDGAMLGAPQRLAVSAVDSLARAMLSTGNLKTLANGPAWTAFGRLVTQLDRLRGYGDFWHYHLLAQGSADAVLESDLNILDVAALALIVEEAGGRVTTLDGGPLTLATRDLLATNGRLHEAVLDALRPAPRP